LRGFIEEFSGNCRFILTCNFKHRIIEPLHSRCTVIDFKIPPKEKAKMAKGFHARLEEILDKEEVKYEPAVLAQLIVKYFPDFRRVLNEIQRYSISGTIDAGILVAPDLGMDTLIKALKSKNFGDIRKWVVDNSDRDTAHVFRSIYDALLDSLTPSQRKAIAFLIRATEECGDYSWNGEDSVWCDDARRTLEVAADMFDVSDPDSF
jgi:DNA polymerase III delta prime subunit